MTGGGEYLISFSTNIVVPDGVLIRELSGESVILNLHTECYFGLDDVGTRMWTLLTSSKSIQAAYETLLVEYNVDAETLRNDLANFVLKLSEKGLIEIHG